MPAVAVFLRMFTQWRYSPMGRLLGLDYTGVRAAMGLMGARNRGQVFDDLQVMERAVLAFVGAKK